MSFIEEYMKFLFKLFLWVDKLKVLSYREYANLLTLIKRNALKSVRSRLHPCIPAESLEESSILP